MASAIDCAWMSVAAYVNKRKPENYVFPSADWQALPGDLGHRSDASGFEASAYSRGTEIVIAFTGTDEGKDWWTNAGGFLGAGTTDEMKSAARLYAEIKRANPSASITFAGHSLGGGLAGLMGVLFDRPAYTFDPAPFRASAHNDTRQAIRDYLDGLSLLTPELAGTLDSFHSSLPAASTGASDEPGIRGEDHVWRISTQSEVLTKWLPNNFIGTPPPEIKQHASPDQSSVDLHSMSLLTALLAAPGFGEAVKQLKNLIPVIFDSRLFNTSPANTDATLLDHLLRNENGVTAPGVTTATAKRGMLGHFAVDLGKITAGGGRFVSDDDLDRGLLAFLGRAYLKQSAGFEAELFKSESGGLSFDTAAIATDLSANEGYTIYLASWLTKEMGDNFSQYQSKIIGAAQWYLADSAMSATAGSTSAFMLGGSGGDILTGGDLIDLLVGGGGVDTLTGGVGEDVLIGGDGNDTLYGNDNAGGDLLDGGDGLDTYYADENDTIRDSDGQGTVYFNGKRLNFATRKKGETEYTDSHGLTYTQTGSTLLVGDPLVIEGFDNGELGIYLDEEEDPDDPAKPPPYNPNNSRRWIDPLALDLDGDGKITTVASSASRAYFDFNNDGIAEKSGWISAGDGLLALDDNGNSVVDGLGELFGTATLDGFADLKTLDTNADNQIDAEDADYAKLKVWQDANGDGISQSSELKTLAELRIDRIGLTATPGHTADADNLIGATASYTQRASDDGPATTKLIADVQFAVNFALTDSNPNHALGTPPSLDADIFQLPWLRGYGNVKSLHVAYQESPALRQAASDLIGLGRDGIFGNFDSFIAKWSGLDAAHAAYGVTRSNLTLEDKVWMLENLTGQNTDKSAIEAVNFGSVFTQNSGSRQGWNDAYIENQYQNFVQREALAFTLQATAKDWLKGAYYSLNLDRFVVTDSPALQAGLQSHLAAVATENDALFAAAALARLKADGVDLAGLSQAIATSSYAALYRSALDFVGEAIRVQTVPGRIAIQGNGGSFVAGSTEYDLLYGGIGNDVLLGGGGSDYLSGGAGNDVLDGGSGNDTLDGGAGNDTYLFGHGAGQDSLSSWDTSTNKRDALRFGTGIATTDVIVSRNGDTLILSLQGTTDRLTVNGYFTNDDTSAYSLQAIEFEDGTVWDFAAVKAMLPPVGTEGNDQLYGFNTADTIGGLGGNDTIDGRGGDDTLNGGAGNDTLYGQAGNDTLNGGSGNDNLQGDVGNDTYAFGSGYGLDVINDADGTSGNLDTVQMADGITPADVTVTRDPGNLYLSLNGGADRLTMQNWFYGDAYKIERVAFVDETVWDAAELDRRIAIAPGTEGNNVIYGREVGDVIDGLGGNDQIYGYGGNDTLKGGSGNDTLDGGAGDDILDGGIGNDNLQGGAGSDTYLFGNGYGQDVINDADGTAGNIDTVQMAEGIMPADVTVTRDQYHLYLSLNSGADRLTLQHWFPGDAYKVECVSFTDGTKWNTAELASRIVAMPATEDADGIFGREVGDVIDGLGGNDQLYGYGGNDTLNGGAGNDTLDGGVGDDILGGGSGNDNLQGGAGNDTYLFGPGSGQDVIYDIDGTTGNLDTVQMAEGVTPADVTVTRDAGNLYLSLNGGTDRLTLQYWFSGNTYRVEHVAFADNTVWDTEVLLAKANVASENADYLEGTSGDNVIDGLGGDDQILGYGGNDTLNGGNGNDSLQGGVGNDTYLFGNGAGQDVIYEYDGTVGNFDTVKMAEGIRSSDVTVTSDAYHTYLSINGSTDRLTLQYSNGIDAYKIERIEFTDGTVWDGGLTAKATAVTAGSDVLVGTAGDDSIDGQGGGDQVWGEDGNDTLVGGAGNDTLHGGAGSDMIDGGAGNDDLQGDAGDDVYLFGPGSGQDAVIDYDTTTGNVDTVRMAASVLPGNVAVTRDRYNLHLSLNGGADTLMVANWFVGDAYKIERVGFADGTVWDTAALTDKVSATEGNDTLWGSTGDDTLDGQGGNDTLHGFEGNDPKNRS